MTEFRITNRVLVLPPDTPKLTEAEEAALARQLDEQTQREVDRLFGYVPTPTVPPIKARPRRSLWGGVLNLDVC